jgi:two-component system CheB/CheR fusion protein
MPRRTRKDGAPPKARAPRAPTPPRGKPRPAAKPATGSRLIPAADPDPILPNVNPAVEPHATPETGLPFPIVAVGASAGGLEAFTDLLKNLAPDTGMAFVLVQHLAPEHTSLLPDILTRATPMRVAQVVDNVEVVPNHVYVIPPGKNMVIAEGHLQLSPRTEARGAARPLDHFMRSLAEEHGHKAIGVVLSGTGTDGTLGTEEIKAAGGITFAQDGTAEHTGMPRNAIAAGAVDFVLPPDEIARELGRIASHPYVSTGSEARGLAGADFTRILDLVRTVTGVDFSNYKRNTLHRRITRRMVLHQIDGARLPGDTGERTRGGGGALSRRAHQRLQLLSRYAGL